MTLSKYNNGKSPKMDGKKPKYMSFAKPTHFQQYISLIPLHSVIHFPDKFRQPNHSQVALQKLSQSVTKGRKFDI